MVSEIHKIAFVVGAGAVENAWQPIIEIIKAASGIKVNADGANSYLARLVYLMRFYSTGTFPDAEKQSETVIGKVNTFKVKISEALRNAQTIKQIKSRQELKDILNRFVFSETNKSVLISTNWDTVIDTAINEIGESNHPRQGSYIETFHIHGSIKSPSSLYLPSEIVREPYRTKDDDTSMGTIHGTAWRTIEECTKTILYGLSLDPLDAELSQTLAVGWSSPNLREIVIINPEHEKVAHRVKLLLDTRYPAEVTGYSPDNLKTMHKY